ncbi:DUF6612 family protein [Lentilactobacillus sunkii]|uniref:Lipoprotein n=1 Tax=Lentilactobacillus sunkii DSM 19904 TaxID=1423808 RepID=A0A0R1KWP8_9LACO|nr:DUF6612 family protein [Lentilactobacillus sunkii]KRK87995.1 hypothetical protein FD17_GL000642 [Lentilactobacillus sunkii DSM 19904]
MKKSIVIGAVLLSMVVAGCAGPNAADVSSHAIKAGKSVKSAHVDLKVNSTSGGTTSKNGVVGKFRTNPTIIKVTQTSDGNPFGGYYIKGNTAYMNNTKKWYKQTGSTSEQTGEAMLKQMNVSQSVETLQAIKDHVSLKTNKSTYVLSYSGKGKYASKAVKSILRKQMNSNVPEAAVNKLLKGVTVSHFSFKYTINKKSYLPVKSSIQMKYSDSASGQTANSDIKGKYSNVNKVKAFDVPASVKSQAKTFKTK